MIICIAGKNSIAVNALGLVHHRYGSAHKIIAIANRSDDGTDGWQPSLVRACHSAGIPLLSLEEIQEISDLLFISLEYDRILKPSKFKSTRLFNIHFSKLPAFKGMYTSALPILMGAQESGVTLHKIDRGIDTGDIIGQRAFSIPPIATARDLYETYLSEGFLLFEDSIDGLVRNRFKSERQRALGSSYFSRAAIDYSNLRIELSGTAEQIHNQVRAFAFREYQLPEILGMPIYRSEILDSRSDGKPGSVVSQSEYTLIINSIDFQLRLEIDQYDRLIRAAADGDIDLYLAIKEHGFPMTARNNRGWDALIVACFHNRGKFVAQLLHDRWDKNSRNYQGTTALMYALSAAVREGSTQALEVLIRAGADVGLRDRFGKTIFDYIHDHGASQILDIFEAAGLRGSN